MPPDFANGLALHNQLLDRDRDLLDYARPADVSMCFPDMFREVLRTFARQRSTSSEKRAGTFTLLPEPWNPRI